MKLPDHLSRPRHHGYGDGLTTASITRYGVSMAKKKAIAFPPQPAIEQRQLIGDDEAHALMRLFKVFANDTRLRLLHALVRD